MDHQKHIQQLEDRILRLEAFYYIQTADLDSLIQIVKDLHEKLGNFLAIDSLFSESFSSLRKRKLHRQLERLELSDPERAARIQEIIDQSWVDHPFTYE